MKSIKTKVKGKSTISKLPPFFTSEDMKEANVQEAMIKYGTDLRKVDDCIVDNVNDEGANDEVTF